MCMARWKEFYFGCSFKLSKQSCVYGFENQDNIQDNQLFHHTNRQSEKIMVSTWVTWKRATKQFFVNDKGLKVNSKIYKKYLEKEFLPEVNRIMNNNTSIFIRDSVPSHRAHIAQDLLKKKFGKKFINNTEWPPSSPGSNPLDYHFGNKINKKVCEDRFNQSFWNSNELKRKIEEVWSEVSHDLTAIGKALK